MKFIAGLAFLLLGDDKISSSNKPLTVYYSSQMLDECYQNNFKSISYNINPEKLVEVEYIFPL